MITISTCSKVTSNVTPILFDGTTHWFRDRELRHLLRYEGVNKAMNRSRNRVDSSFYNCPLHSSPRSSATFRAGVTEIYNRRFGHRKRSIFGSKRSQLNPLWNAAGEHLRYRRRNFRAIRLDMLLAGDIAQDNSIVLYRTDISRLTMDSSHQTPNTKPYSRYFFHPVFP